MSHPFARLLGAGETTGRIRPTDEHAAVPVAGSDTYEWAVASTAILHRVDVHVGDDHVRSCEMIGPSATPGEYFMHAYDATGDFARMIAKVSGNRFTFEAQRPMSPVRLR